jgi:uncharacterized protein YdaU (DUF1376 family)
MIIGTLIEWLQERHDKKIRKERLDRELRQIKEYENNTYYSAQATEILRRRAKHDTSNTQGTGSKKDTQKERY